MKTDKKKDVFAVYEFTMTEPEDKESRHQEILEQLGEIRIGIDSGNFWIVALLVLILVAICCSGCTTTTYERDNIKITHSTPMIFGKQFDKLDIQRIGDDATLTIENYRAVGAEEIANVIAAYLSARGLK